MVYSFNGLIGIKKQNMKEYCYVVSFLLIEKSNMKILVIPYRAFSFHPIGGARIDATPWWNCSSNDGVGVGVHSIKGKTATV